MVLWSKDVAGLGAAPASRVWSSASGFDRFVDLLQRGIWRAAVDELDHFIAVHALVGKIGCELLDGGHELVGCSLD